MQYSFTTESKTGKKMLAVLKFDVTSVNKPLMMIIRRMTPARGIPARKRNARATLIDNFEVYNREKLSRGNQSGSKTHLKSRRNH